jgi:hypothetical protein
MSVDAVDGDDVCASGGEMFVVEPAQEAKA